MIGSRIIERSEAESTVRNAFCLVLEAQIDGIAECVFRLSAQSGHDEAALKNAMLKHEVAKELLEEFRSGGPKSCAKPAKGDD